MPTDISAKAIEMIKHHEGVRQKPYQCPALLWTVGVGHVIDSNHIRLPLDQRKALPIPEGYNRVLSMEEVNEILRKDLATFVKGVLRLCPAAANNQGHLDALTSFSFNVGLGNLQKSTIRMKYNRGDFEGAAEGFLDWTKAGGKVLKGLVSRRNDERALFLSGA
jgi:lysozyme